MLGFPALGLVGFCGGWKSVGFVMLTFLYGRYTAASPPRPVLDELSSDFDVKGTNRGPMAPLNDTEAETSIWDKLISLAALCICVFFERPPTGR